MDHFQIQIHHEKKYQLSPKIRGAELWESGSVTIGLSHGLVMIGTVDTCVSVKVCIREDN